MRYLLAAMVVASACLTGSNSSMAAAFFGWQVVDVAAGELLNVRAFPSSWSRVLVGYPNGTRLSLTGRGTGRLHLDAVGGRAAWKQRQAVRERWCEAWLDPSGSGEFRSGWVRGRYMRPI